MIKVNFKAIFLRAPLIALVVWPIQASFGFPGMQRHGYFNCTSCHVSPSGGGVLNPYGRQLSGEVLSAWTTPGENSKETDFLYGSVAKSLSEKFYLGGDVRTLSTYTQNPMFTEKRFFLMQADLEAAYKIGKFTFDLEAGYIDSDDFQSLRHFILFQVDDQSAFRFGKFKNNYGINTDEHQLTIKSNLGFGPETETYNLEYSWLSENTSLFFTGLFGAPEGESHKRGLAIGRIGMVDHGVSARVAQSIGISEIGISSFYGKKAHQDWRSTSGIFGVIGFTPQFYYMGEIDFQDQSKWGIFNYQRLTYEWIQGFQTFVSQELAETQFGSSRGRVLRYGVGLQFYPRPHYEISIRGNLEENPYGESTFSSNGWLLLHYYL